jgi:hypothetical protein
VFGLSRHHCPTDENLKDAVIPLLQRGGCDDQEKGPVPKLEQTGWSELFSNHPSRAFLTFDGASTPPLEEGIAAALLFYPWQPPHRALAGGAVLSPDGEPHGAPSRKNYCRVPMRACFSIRAAFTRVQRASERTRYSIHQDEGFDLYFEVKHPGQPVRIETGKLHFRYAEAFPSWPMPTKRCYSTSCAAIRRCSCDLTLSNFRGSYMSLCLRRLRRCILISPERQGRRSLISCWRLVAINGSPCEPTATPRSRLPLP